MKWPIPAQNKNKQEGGWGHGISKGIEEIASGFSRN